VLRCTASQPCSDESTESCCCNHGEPCTCHRTKRESLLDTVRESDESDVEPALSRTTSKQSKEGRRRANTTDVAPLTFDQHGHHKPTYKHTKPHETSGPYQLTRIHSGLGHDRLTNRSVDNLLHYSGQLDEASSYSPAGLGAVGFDLRLTRSETASPHIDGFPPSGTFASTSEGDTGLAVDVPTDFFSGTPDVEQPLFSAGIAPSVDWSIYEGLEFSAKPTDSFAPSNFSQPLGFEQIPALTTTTSNSGTASEADDYLISSNADAFVFGSMDSSTASLPLDLGQGGLAMSGQGLGIADFEQLDFQADTLQSDKLFTPSATTIDDIPFLASAGSGVSGPAAFSTSDGESPFFAMPDSIGSLWESS
jgi:hypothetical protein